MTIGEGVISADRGDTLSVDFDLTLNCDGAWHTLDLSTIVPANKRIVIIRFSGHTAYNNYFYMKRHGANASTLNRSEIRANTSGSVLVYLRQDCFVFCDANRLIDYLGSDLAAGGWVSVTLTVSAFWS